MWISNSLKRRVSMGLMTGLMCPWLACLLVLCPGEDVSGDEIVVLDLTRYQDGSRMEADGHEVVRAPVSGKVCHFCVPGSPPAVEGVNVRISGFPEGKSPPVLSDENGTWKMILLKYAGVDLEVSFVYEKRGWVTTKSNLLTISDEGRSDIAIQYINPHFYLTMMKPLVDRMLASLTGDGGMKMHNALVATVGKSWASMYDERLPHGDPGAIATPVPGSIGPLYFNESVVPDASRRNTSVDGGVAWFNVSPGVHTVSASRKGVEYEEVKFIVGENDAAEGVVLYIASPPDSIQGTDDSVPGR